MNPYAAQYATVAASQTTQKLGKLGAKGDYLERLIIVPAATNAGTVSITDGTGTAINVFVTGTLADLSTIVVPLGIYSTSGAWQVTTGGSVSVVAVGRFTEN